MTQEQRQLVDAIRGVFADGPFDTSSVLGKAMKHPELVAAVEAVVPNSRYRSGYRRGRLKDKPLRRVLTALAEQHFTTGSCGWWYVRGEKPT
jgi:hypothetical protein